LLSSDAYQYESYGQAGGQEAAYGAYGMFSLNYSANDTNISFILRLEFQVLIVSVCI